ncbi:hypothetical protein CEUSTIGMA_g12387.t1, partial [Chlamydomonas eustigma]
MNLCGHNRRCAVLFALFVIALLYLQGLAAAMNRKTGHGTQSRSLLQQLDDYSAAGVISENFSLDVTTLSSSQGWSFPYATCGSYACSAGTPYSMTVVTDQPGQMCFKMWDNGCNSTCCAALRALTNKVEFRTSPICNTSIDSVFVNGVQRGGGIYFDTFSETEARLRITNLRWTQNQGASALICVNLKPGHCYSPGDSLCMGAPSGQCVYSMVPYDSGTGCCPVCTTGPQVELSPPLTMPSPPPPPPPAPPPPSPPPPRP